MFVYQDLIRLIIAFTCVGVFIATALASVLDMFNLLRLQPDLRRKLQVALLIEIVGISTTAFAGFLNPTQIVDKVESQKTQLEKQIADSTRAAVRQSTPSARDERGQAAREIVSDFPWVDTATVPGFTVVSLIRFGGRFSYAA